MTPAQMEKALVGAIETLVDDVGCDPISWDELCYDAIEKITEKAVLLRIKGQSLWFPLSQLRQLDGTVYAAFWIMEQKGLS